MNAHLLLAADFGDVLGVLFVIVALVSGIVSKFKENKAAEEIRERRAQRGGQGREQLQDEISLFLEELGSETPSGRAQSRPQKSRREQTRSGRQSQSSGMTNERGESGGQQRARSRRGQKRPADEISSVKSRHVHSSVQDRHVRSDVHNRHLDSDVGDQMVGRLVESVSDARDVQTSAIAAAGLPPVAQLLTRRDGIASAIVLNEILSPPVSRRPKRHN